jgi:hypothetical protein
MVLYTNQPQGRKSIGAVANATVPVTVVAATVVTVTAAASSSTSTSSLSRSPALLALFHQGCAGPDHPR